MAFKFPFTNYHELNLTWVLEQLKKLFEESNENVETIESYENRLSAVETELPTVEATAEQAATVANAAASLAQTAKNTADTANENSLTASAQAGLARQEAAGAEAEAQAATQAAQQTQAIVQDFDGRITQAEADASEALQEAQSFENRVNAAINTANNAANTATIAQGIAVNANQHAATALDTAQTADGKAEAAQDTADLADEKADTNAANIGNLSDLTTTAKNNLVAAINEAAQTGGGTDDTKAPLIVSEASGAVASFSDGANNMQMQELVCTIEPVQAGTGDPSPTNVRPISGHNGMTIIRTGKNLYDQSKLERSNITYENGVLTGIAGAFHSHYGQMIPNLPKFNNGQYTFSLEGYTDGNASTAGYGIIISFKYTDGTNTTAQLSNSTSQFTRSTITSALNKEIEAISIGYNSTGSNVWHLKNIQLEYSSTSTEYEPYNGTIIPITWETEAGAIYGGLLNVVTGELISNRVILRVTSLITAFKNENGEGCSCQFYVSPAAVSSIASVAKLYCNMATGTNYSTLYNNHYHMSNTVIGQIYFSETLFTNTQEATTWFSNNPVYISYITETTQSYQLTPHELQTLLGENNIWTDVGAIQSCKYPADTKLYIDGKVAELQALILEN